MPEEKKFDRRSIRLRGADYSEPGAYFITICAAQRRNIFGNIDGGRVVLSPLGEIVRACWIEIPEHFARASAEQFVVMPNHLHGIIGLTVGARYIVPLDRAARMPEKFQKPAKGSIPTIIRTFKAAVARRARKELKGTINRAQTGERLKRHRKRKDKKGTIYRAPTGERLKKHRKRKDKKGTIYRAPTGGEFRAWRRRLTGR